MEKGEDMNTIRLQQGLQLICISSPINYTIMMSLRIHQEVSD